MIETNIMKIFKRIAYPDSRANRERISYCWSVIEPTCTCYICLYIFRRLSEAHGMRSAFSEVRSKNQNILQFSSWNDEKMYNNKK